jgi:hypothetical protein
MFAQFSPLWLGDGLGNGQHSSKGFQQIRLYVDSVETNRSRDYPLSLSLVEKQSLVKEALRKICCLA